MEAIERPEVFKLRYPTGKFQPKENYTMDETLQSIEKISRLPDLYIAITSVLKHVKLNETYREGGWPAIKVINHLVDTYLNAYIRTKWLLTEEKAVLKPYDENEFAKLADSTFNDLDSTLLLVKLIVNRLIFLLRSLPPEKFDVSIYHPEYKTDFSLHKLIAMYDWHGYHHLAHLEIIKNKN